MTLTETLRDRILASHEPLWREVAYRCVIVSFFSLPLVVLILHLTLILDRLNLQHHSGEFSYLWRFHQLLAGLLAAMLGLNSWDKHAIKSDTGAMTNESQTESESAMRP
jgi:hypothetical protein